MSLSHQLVTLNTTTPTILTIAPANEPEYSRELTVSIQNLDSTNFVLLGGSNVSTSSYGFRIDPGQTFTATLSPTDDLYAVSHSGTPQVGVIRVVTNG
jgi:hypothetical protein